MPADCASNRCPENPEPRSVAAPNEALLRVPCRYAGEPVRLQASTSRHELRITNCVLLALGISKLAGREDGALSLDGARTLDRTPPHRLAQIRCSSGDAPSDLFGGPPPPLMFLSSRCATMSTPRELSVIEMRRKILWSRDCHCGVTSRASPRHPNPKEKIEAREFPAKSRFFTGPAYENFLYPDVSVVQLRRRLSICSARILVSSVG